MILILTIQIMKDTMMIKPEHHSTTWILKKSTTNKLWDAIGAAVEYGLMFRSPRSVCIFMNMGNRSLHGKFQQVFTDPRGLATFVPKECTTIGIRPAILTEITMAWAICHTQFFTMVALQSTAQPAATGLGWAIPHLMAAFAYIPTMRIPLIAWSEDMA